MNLAILCTKDIYLVIFGVRGMAWPYLISVRGLVLKTTPYLYFKSFRSGTSTPPLLLFKLLSSSWLWPRPWHGPTWPLDWHWPNLSQPGPGADTKIRKSTHHISGCAMHISSCSTTDKLFEALTKAYIICMMLVRSSWVRVGLGDWVGVWVYVGVWVWGLGLG